MTSTQIWGIAIALVSIIGGMALTVFILKIVLPPQYQERMTMMENQSKERLALIEKGIDPATLLKKEKKISQDPLFWGLLLAGIGAGSFFGSMVGHNLGPMSETDLKNALGCLGGGLGLIVYHVIQKIGSGKKAA